MANMLRVGKVATTIRKEGLETKIRFHQTDVVSFDDNQIKLDTGGWFTKTTKTRMNQASHQFNLGFRVYQRKGFWYVFYHGKVYSFSNSQTLILNRSNNQFPPVS